MANNLKTHFPIEHDRNMFPVGRYPVENRTLNPSDPGTLFNQHNRNGKPVLQHCKDCGVVQYPSREVCRHCLSNKLEWRDCASDLATVVSTTKLMHSLEYRYRDRTPWYVLSVQLQIENNVGTILVHSNKAFTAGQTVRLTSVVDENKTSIIFACKTDKDPQKMWRKLQTEKISLMTPRDRNKIHE